MTFESESGPLHYNPDESSTSLRKKPTAFELYANEMRQKNREKHSDLSDEELELKMETRCEELDNDEKDKYKKKLKKMRSAERPTNAYMFWCKEHRREFARLDKSLAGSDATKLLAEQFDG